MSSFNGTTQHKPISGPQTVSALSIQGDVGALSTRIALTHTRFSLSLSLSLSFSLSVCLCLYVCVC
eukprot:COSAG03_NODE_4836_length_1416_cov_2.053910_3_plen_65_part_01